MKRKSTGVSSWYIFLLISVVVYSCMKDDSNDPRSTAQSEVQFSIDVSASSGGRTENDESDVQYILFSIESSDGSSPYTQEQLEVYEFSGEFISEPFSLQVGDYQLTEFYLLDGEGDVIFASPLEGSEMAKLVDDPLAIDFEVMEDEVTKLTPEVVSTESSNAADFGYGAFGFEVVDYFEMQLVVMAYLPEEDNYKLLSSELNIEADGELIVEESLDATTTELKIKDEDYGNYTLSITSDGYDDFTYTYSADSLKGYEGGDPLIVVMDENDLEYKGLLYGIVEDSAGVLSFASISYDGVFKLISELSGVDEMINWSSRFDKESGYYHFTHSFNNKTHLKLIDELGQDVISSQITSFNTVYSSNEDILYGIRFSNNTCTFHSIDLNANVSDIEAVGPYLGFGIWGAYDKNGFYFTRVTDFNQNAHLLIYGFDWRTASTIDISSNKISGSQLVLVEEDELFYGFASNNSGGYSLNTMDYKGVETVISTNVGKQPVDLNHITYDETNELFITSYGKKLYIFDKSGVLVNELSLEGLGFDIPSLRAGQ